jgi:hypothetical protein
MLEWKSRSVKCACTIACRTGHDIEMVAKEFHDLVIVPERT